jgi:hypothetical protein
LISVLKALAIRSPVSFNRGAGAKVTGAEAGIGAKIGAEAKIKIKIAIEIKIEVVKNIFKDRFSLYLLTR